MNRQSRDAGKIGHRMKTNKMKNITQKSKRWATKNPGVNPSDFSKNGLCCLLFL
jgi:hypothetical protein